MSSVQNDSGVYIIINNIPKDVRSIQLRNFFSSFVESGGFICFHYIHRPEVQESSNSTDDVKQRRSVSSCCIAKVAAPRVHQFIETYNGRHWLDLNGETLPTCCFIKRIKLSDNDSSIPKGCKYAIPFDREEFSIKELESLREMRPPSYMPNGNVGTTTDYFLNEIRMSRLPKGVMDKLGLSFPSDQARENYNAFNFMSKKERRKLKASMKKSNPYLIPSFQNQYWHAQLPGEFSYREDGHYKEILHPKAGYFDAKTSENWVMDNGIYKEPGYRWAIPKYLPAHQEGATKSMQSLFEMHSPSFMSHGNVGYAINPQLAVNNLGVTFPWNQMPYPNMQEWHQNQALHHGYGQGTLFEKDKWKKLSSSWVSGKDAQYWKSNEGYFDVKTSEDLDTNTDISKKSGVDNNKDTKNLEEGHRNGTETEVDKRCEFAGFEKYNKGIGSKILKALGWKEGQGIGKNGDGIAEPLPNEGQCNKKGFGYQDKKLNSLPPTKKIA